VTGASYGRIVSTTTPAATAASSTLNGGIPATPKSLLEAITEQLEEDKYLSFLWSHATRLAAVLASLLIILKIFAVAHFDANVALTLATVSSVPATLLSLVISFAPIVVAVLAFSSWLIADDFWAAGERRWLILLPAITLTVGSFAVTPWLLFAYLSGLGIYLLVLFRVGRFAFRTVYGDAGVAGLHRPERDLPPVVRRFAPLIIRFADATSGDASQVLGRIGRNIVFALLGATVALVATYDLPWLPAEQLSLADGTAVVGYVLAQSPDSLTVLLDSDRTATMYPATGIRQAYCRKSDAKWEDMDASKSALQWVLAQSKVGLPHLTICQP
jgi:hypothetical protein